MWPGRHVKIEATNVPPAARNTMTDALQPTTEPNESENPVALVSSVLDDEELDLGGALNRLEKVSASFEQFAGHPQYQLGVTFLDASQSFFAALLRAQSAEFSNAFELMTHAHDGFEAIGHHGIAQASEGLRLYYAGVVAAQGVNLGAATERFKEAQQFLDKAGVYGQRFRPLIDHMAPDQLFLAGVAALLRQDSAAAKGLLEEAALKAEYVAHKYYSEADANRSLFLGLAQFHRAYFRLFESYNNLRMFKIDPIRVTDEGVTAARQARALLGEAELDNILRRRLFSMAGVLSALFDVIGPVSRVVASLLGDTALPAIDYDALTSRLREASDEGAQLGEQGAVFIQISDQMQTTLANVRRFHLARRTTAEARPSYSPVRLFAMMPFSEACADLEQALRNIFEDEPYCFQVILARDRTVKRSLFDNVKEHMKVVNGFLADITDLNPNVMLELGMTENDPLDRPVLILREKQGKEPPSDLKGRLYVEYSRPGGEQSERIVAIGRELRERLEAIDDIERLRSARQQRYLSSRYINRQLDQARLNMKPDEIERLQNQFRTVEELMQADAATIAQRAGFPPNLASLVARVFKAKIKKGSRSSPPA
jgi:hypothetical protein